MAAYTDGVRVTGYIAPSDTSDVYPTHLSILGKGGYREVNSITDRDNIPSERCSVGMLVCVSGGDIYKLTNISPKVWELFNSSVGSISGSYVSTINSLSGSVNIVAGNNIAISISGSNIIISTSISGGGTDHNTLSNLQGGDISGNFYHLSKSQYDDFIGKEEASSLFVNISGDTMTGNLAMSGAAIDFDINYIPPWKPGRVFYDDQVHSLAYYNDSPDITINIGQEEVVRARNTTGSIILNGTVVCISGSSGNHPLLRKASNSDEELAHSTLGVATHDISDNEDGYITVSGLVNNLDTSGFSADEGSILWLGTNGGITDVQPTAPTHKIKIGYLIRKHITQGRILVAINTGLDLQNIHDVLITAPVSGDVLSFDGIIWKNGFNINDYATVSSVYSISGNLQSQINSKQNEITLVAGNNINISESPSDTWIISANISGSSSLMQGIIPCDTNNIVYNITHPAVDLNYSFPVVSLIVPASGSNLFVHGITNRTVSSFDVTLSEVPNISGYFISWHLPTTNTSLNSIPVINLAITNIQSTTLSVSGTYDVLLSETIVYVEENVTVKLPSSPTSNESHWIVNIYNSDITIHGNGKNISIDGINNPTLLLSPDSSLHIHFNSFKNKWYVI